MVVVHVLVQYGDASARSSPGGIALTALVGPTGAPTFMFLMGASLAFSRHATTRSLMRRGALLFGAGYALNIARGTLPTYLGLTTGVVTEAQIAPYTILTTATIVDIYQLAGLALLGLGLLGSLRQRPAALLLVALAVAFVSPTLWGVRTAAEPLDALLLPLWGTDWNVFFPAFPWLAYPLVGLALGTTLVRSPDPSRLLRRAGLVGIGVAALGTVGLFLTGRSLSQPDFWRQDPVIMAFVLGLVPTWLWVCDLAARRLPHTAVQTTLYGWSRRVMPMYVIHWLLLGWGVALLGFHSLPLLPLLPVMALTLLATHWLASRTPDWHLRQAYATLLMRPFHRAPFGD